MKIIKCIVQAMDNNIHQAKQHILHAYELMRTDRTTADWFKQMAQSHLKFNTVGHNAAQKAIEAFKARYPESELTPGMMAVYNDKHADMLKETAQVKYLIDNYGK